jgi:hypothetical protein
MNSCPTSWASLRPPGFGGGTATGVVEEGTGDVGTGCDDGGVDTDGDDEGVGEPVGATAQAARPNSTATAPVAGPRRVLIDTGPV